MKKIKILTMAAMLMVTGTIAAQYKQFTLDDLLGGGTTYWNLQPENRYLQWWGSVAVETTPDEVKKLSDGQVMFTVKDLNEWAGETVARNGHRLSFPYPNEAFVLTNTAQKRFLLDFQRKALVWSQAIPEGAKMRIGIPKVAIWHIRKEETCLFSRLRAKLFKLARMAVQTVVMMWYMVKAFIVMNLE